MPYLKLSNACLAYGHVPLLDHAEFQLDPGERVALIGRNGTGKSSLLAALAAGSGKGRLDDGEVWVQPGIRVGYVPQEPPFDPEHSVFEAVISGMGETSTLLAEYHEVSHRLSEGQGDHDALLARMDTLQHELEARGAWAYEAQAEKVIARFGLDPEAQVGSLSGGQKKLLELGRTMMTDAKLVLLDEPAAGVNRTLLRKLEEKILILNRDWGYTFILIEHDMEMIEKLCQPVVCMAEGKVLIQGDFHTVRSDARVLEAYLGETPSAIERNEFEHDPKVEQLREQELHKEDL